MHIAKDKVLQTISADLFLMVKESKMMIPQMVSRWRTEMKLMSWLNKLEVVFKIMSKRLVNDTHSSPNKFYFLLKNDLVCLYDYNQKKLYRKIVSN